MREPLSITTVTTKDNFKTKLNDIRMHNKFKSYCYNSHQYRFRIKLEMNFNFLLKLLREM